MCTFKDDVGELIVSSDADNNLFRALKNLAGTKVTVAAFNFSLGNSTTVVLGTSIGMISMHNEDADYLELLGLIHFSQTHGGVFEVEAIDSTTLKLRSAHCPICGKSADVRTNCLECRTILADTAAA